MDYDGGSGVWEGAGDGPSFEEEEIRSVAKEPKPTPFVKRRLGNGIVVPAYLGETEPNPIEDDIDIESDTMTFHSFSHHRHERHPPPIPPSPSHQHHQSCSASKRESTSSNVWNPKKSLPEILKSYLGCPICRDICIEVTSTNCGHKFCKDCLEKWTKEKMICPVCSTLITHTHRLYSDDQMIESQLHYYGEDAKFRYETAREKRLKALKKESKRSKEMLRRIRRRLDDSVIYLRLKNRREILLGLGGVMIILWGVGMALMFLKNYMMVTIATTGTGGWKGPSSNFFKYVWLAVKQYNGSIPEEWLETKIMAEKVVDVDPRSWVEWGMDKLWPFGWW